MTSELTVNIFGTKTWQVSFLRATGEKLMAIDVRSALEVSRTPHPH